MPVVDTTQSFATGDTVTSTTLNNIMDQSIFVAGAVVSGSGLAITAGGQMTTSNIPGANIVNGTITSAKIENGTIVNDDINASAAIGLSKLGSGALPTTITIASANIVNGTIVADDIANDTITASKLNGAQSGTAPIFGVRAWVNFDATRDSTGNTNSSNTNRFIRSSGNVESVLKTATGKYTITFTTAMPNANYVGVCNCNADAGGNPRFAALKRNTSTTLVAMVETDDIGGSPGTYGENSVIIIG